VANSLREFRRHLTRGDVQNVFVVNVEDLRHQPGAHGVGLAEIVIDNDPHGSIVSLRWARGHRRARR
jgi:hypothetical protein